jgi:hypothetical protein
MEMTVDFLNALARIGSAQAPVIAVTSDEQLT